MDTVTRQLLRYFGGKWRLSHAFIASKMKL